MQNRYCLLYTQYPHKARQCGVAEKINTPLWNRTCRNISLARSFYYFVCPIFRIFYCFLYTIHNYAFHRRLIKSAAALMNVLDASRANFPYSNAMNKMRIGEILTPCVDSFAHFSHDGRILHNRRKGVEITAATVPDKNEQRNKFHSRHHIPSHITFRIAKYDSRKYLDRQKLSSWVHGVDFTSERVVVFVEG